MRIHSVTFQYQVPSVYTYNSNKAKQEISFEGRFSNGLLKPRHIKPYYAYLDFARYNPRTVNFGKYKIPVHNEEVARHLKPHYNSQDFENLFEFSQKKGVFDIVMDEKKGFVKTSFINSKENPLMSDLVWITDSCNNMALVKKQNPELCTTVLNRLADLYEGQQANFDEVIANPSIYKHNDFWGGAKQKGVGHCFVPQTKLPHKWFAKTRLESVGNYLQTATDMIMTGFNGGKYGYKSVAEVPDTVVKSISNTVKYLDAIHYPTARSCGVWEEQTFVNSLSSDTSIVNQGLRDIMELMYSPTENKNLLALRGRILNTKYGDIFADKSRLEKLLKDGEQRIIEQPDVETSKGFYSKKVKSHEEKCLQRDYDAAMSFIHQTETLVSEDVLKDSAKKLFLLKKLATSVVRPNGAIRYHGDDYLNLDYHTLKNQWTGNKHSNEAEWFLVSEISAAYGAVAKNLLNKIAKTGNMTPEDKKLLTIAINGQTEHINRSYARITPKKMTKANGYSCPAYKLPEAYEAVTTRNGSVKYVPGAHTLAWASSSLFKASNSFAENLKMIEKLNIKLT